MSAPASQPTQFAGPWLVPRCPTCNASPGYRCRGVVGLLREVHASRRELAALIQDHERQHGPSCNE